MTEDIKWTVSVAIAGGPSVAQSETTSVDAYDRIEVQVKKGTTATVDVVSSSTTLAKIKFLLITSDFLSDKLTYKINNKAPSIPLDTIQFLTGGTLILLPDVPSQIQFDNTTVGNQDANIKILVGRLAVS